MFIQVIQGPCTRQDELRSWAKNWKSEVGGGATGWLGGTFGFTPDDQFIGVVRFTTRETAAANSARPEQGAWAEKMMSLMAGDVSFSDYDDVMEFLDGGSDDAGFVQVIRGKVTDRDQLKVMFADTEGLRAMRPEIIGGTFAVDANGGFTQTVAFTDEASARAGEGAEPPEEIREALGSVMAGASFYDLKEPWFESP